MTKHHKRDEELNEVKQELDEVRQEAEACAGAAEEAEAVQAEKIAEMQAEIDKLKDLYLRSQAEMENLRRRTQQELENVQSLPFLLLRRIFCPSMTICPARWPVFPIRKGKSE